MLKTKAIFDRKAVGYAPTECVIEKVITLPTDEYDQFFKNMSDDYDFIKDNKDLQFCDTQGVYHCILVVGEDRRDGVLIESEGYDYARYSAFLPNAADYLSAAIKQEKPSLKETEVANLKLKDLIMVPLEDIHLVHSDEEIDLATICELKKDTLTSAGREEWADVLNADVHRIFDGVHGVQIEVSGVDPQRLSRFSFMLAGHCSEQDYEKWVTQEPEAPDVQMKQL